MQRLGLGVLTLFIVSIVIFIAVNLLPGDFAQLILGQGATPEAVEAFEKTSGSIKDLLRDTYNGWAAR